MKLETLESIFRALADNGVRYLVAGGVAVNVHGYQRATQDLDLVVQLDRDNVLRALEALESLGYRPLLPVPGKDFAEEKIRRAWRETRHVEVFSLVSDLHPGTTVDIFAAEPFPFEEESTLSFRADLAPGMHVPCVRIERLITMKEELGRPRDPGRRPASPLDRGRAREGGGVSDRPWEAGTWEGARRAQLRRALRLSVRERLEIMVALTETAARLAELGAATRSRLGEESRVARKRGA